MAAESIYTDSDMTGANNWIEALGSLPIDINSTVSNKMYLDFTSGNQAIKLDNALEIGKEYEFKITAKLTSGTGMDIRFGSIFTSGVSGEFTEFAPTATETEAISEPATRTGLADEIEAKIKEAISG